jgi:hypothetical protein
MLSNIISTIACGLSSQGEKETGFFEKIRSLSYP